MSIYYVNPSLKELYNFIYNDYNNLLNYEKEMFNKENFKIIDYYLFNILNNDKKILKKHNNLTVNICEYINLYIYESITDDTIKKIEKIFDNEYNNYDKDEYYNGLELYSIYEKKNRFECLKRLYLDYKSFITHIKYMPGNIGYIETYKNYKDKLIK